MTVGNWLDLFVLLQVSISMKFYKDLQKYGADEVFLLSTLIYKSLIITSAKFS